MPTPEQIDSILPQTQCGLCGFNGCMPYAQALAQQKTTINLCPPGGVKGLLAIAQMMEIDPTPYIEDMEQKAKPQLIAFIREAECIGCTKCIQACPVDAILGTSKNMHTVITDECTGCELCVSPCPVDCIEMVKLDREIDEAKSTQYRNRYQARKKRLEEEKIKQATLHAEKVQGEKKTFVQEALLRAKSKNVS